MLSLDIGKQGGALCPIDGPKRDFMHAASLGQASRSRTTPEAGHAGAAIIDSSHEVYIRQKGRNK